MKKILKISVIAFLAFFLSAYTADEITRQIGNTIESGDAAQLSEYFSDNIRLKIDEKDNIYSRKQAEAIIGVFFSGNSPKSYKITSERKSGYSQIVIGIMHTNQKKFRVYYQLAGEKAARRINFLDIQMLD
ncbi:MAG: DUF4783 domain-containing protein [Bacteroidota bacterium]|nr:DUF4783 domain-containing protein [Bacteroidota bacterium]